MAFPSWLSSACQGSPTATSIDRLFRPAPLPSGPLPVPGPPQRRVRPVRRHQLVMGAQFGEPAVLHHGHPVRVVRGVQPVRDGDDRTALAARRPGRARCAGRSSGRAAPSPRRGSGCAGRPAPRAPGPAAGPASRPCGCRRRPAPCRGRRAARRTQPSAPTAVSAAHTSLVRGRRLGDPEVVADRAEEDVVLLGDQDDLAAQLLRPEVATTGHPADRHRAGGRRVDAGEQPAQRRLAGAGRADHRQPFARPDGQVDVAAAPRRRGRRRSARRSRRSGRPSGAGGVGVRRPAGPAPGPPRGRTRRRCSGVARPASGSRRAARPSAAGTAPPATTAPEADRALRVQ